MLRLNSVSRFGASLQQTARASPLQVRSAVLLQQRSLSSASAALRKVQTSPAVSSSSSSSSPSSTALLSRSSSFLQQHQVQIQAQQRTFIGGQEPVNPNNPRKRDSNFMATLYTNFFSSTPAYVASSFILAVILAFGWNTFCEAYHKSRNAGRFFEDMIEKHPSPYPPGTEPDDDEDDEDEDEDF